jgi:Carboxypeptidase regulatory-like domain/TonB-dependent Receptor Plug Domain
VRNTVRLLTCGAVLFPALLGAQGGGSGTTAEIPRDTAGILTGRVVAADGIPIAQARVRVIGHSSLVLSDNDGRFTIAAVRAGAQVLEVRLLGYAAYVQWVKVSAGQTLDVSVTLVAAPVPLKAVEVKGAEPLRPALAGYEQRRAHGNGHFLNQAEIARIQPHVITDVLRRIPGVMLQPAAGSFGLNDAVRMNRTIGISGSRNCPVLFYVNGMPLQVTGDQSIDQYVAPEDVVAIEVYSGSSQIPPEFQSSLLNSRCGVIVIWTKVGEDSEEPPPATKPHPRPPAPPPPPPPSPSSSDG